MTNYKVYFSPNKADQQPFPLKNISKQEITECSVCDLTMQYTKILSLYIRQDSLVLSEFSAIPMEAYCTWCIEKA